MKISSVARCKLRDKIRFGQRAKKCTLPKNTVMRPELFRKPLKPIKSVRIVLKSLGLLTALSFFLVAWAGPHGGRQFLWDILLSGLLSGYAFPTIIGLEVALSLIALALIPFIAAGEKAFLILIFAALGPTFLLVSIIATIAEMSFYITLASATPFFVGTVATILFSLRSSRAKPNGEPDI